MNRPTAYIAEASATGDEIDSIIRVIEPVLHEATDNRAHAIISMLTIAISIMKPEVTAEELQDVVKGTSQYICLALDESHRGNIVGEHIHPTLMN